MSAAKKQKSFVDKLYDFLCSVKLSIIVLIGLAVTASLWRSTLRPIGKVLFHWGLFVCALWVAGNPYDSIFYKILISRTFGF